METGAFIIPTGVGASIGGFAGDAGRYARMFASKYRLIVNPNVVNAGCFSAITENMLYVEGFSLDEFFKNRLNLIPVNKKNKIGVIFDKSIPDGIISVHINTINAVKTVYDCDITGYEITEEKAGVEFCIDKSGISTGSVKNISTLVKSGKKLIGRGAEALAVVCRFKDDDFEPYSNGIGVDPVGGVEAVISHYLSRELKVPCAHSPAFDDITITQNIVDARCSAEYITPTYLPCVLLGLSQAPKLNFDGSGISVCDLKFLVMPYNSIGSIPVFECLKRNISVFAVKENKTVLDITPDKISNNIKIIDTYVE
ncbi:MAG: DUF3326 domain-containing protein, partial [Candidatus Gastranaerophilales bacterium]|nr:DUF3326 domain-containing protein [Candidatus Gastranaerophilales bacterium]